MVPQLSLAYECINAIGNSLELEEMLLDIMSTFVDHTQAIGGSYVHNSSLGVETKAHVGSGFVLPQSLSANKESFEIHEADEISLCILDIPVHEGHFLFAFREQEEIGLLGDMFVGFRRKITNAIESCLNVQKLTHQISEERDKNALNEQLMISQSRMAIMGEMIGMIAHQWRQPITIIGMVTNNMIIDLHMNSFETQRAIKDLETVDKQVHYLSRTIDDFRNFFKPNKLAQEVSFHQISHELQVILGKSFQSSNIKLSFEGAADLKIWTFKNELLQVLLNILTNAKDAFGEKDIQNAGVSLRAKAQEGTLQFYIEDNAGGIDPRIVNKIFDPYFSTKNEKNGTGLGLYMSAIIVEKHLGGKIMLCLKNDGVIFEVSIASCKEKTSVY